MERIKQLTGHLSAPKGVAALQVQSPDDIVVTMAVRSPLGKQGKGAFKGVQPDDFLTAFLKSALANTKIDPALIEDLVVGNVLTPGAAYVTRAAGLTAGIPETTPIQTLNRFCSSGLMALSAVSNRIRAGEIDVGLAVGFETMSTTPDAGAPKMNSGVTSCQVAADSLMPMGWTSENVAAEYHIAREDMDYYAYLSQSRAQHAQETGRFDAEIVPVTLPSNPEDPASPPRTISKDDVPRNNTTLPTLLKIRSAFPQWSPSYTTGGNASQNADGAAAVLLMKRKKAEELGLKILAKHITTVTVGVPPRVMGIGPVYAIPKALEKAGIQKNDVDLYEINEAFASQYVYCIRKLGLDSEKVNVNGGAIALGHPLGATGARQVATGLSELEKRNGKVLVTSMCMGTGMGAAAVFVRD